VTLIHQLLLQVFDQFPHRPLFFGNGQYHTYGEAKESVFKLAGNLATKQEELIGLVGHQDFSTYKTILACWLAGKGYIPIDPDLPAIRAYSILNKAGAKEILSSGPPNREKIEGELQNKGITISPIQALEEAGQTLKPKEINPNSIAYMLFTSGSTGEPKGVPITFGNLAAFVDSFLAQDVRLSEEDRWLQPASFSFDLSVIATLIPWCAQWCVQVLNSS